MRRLCRSPSGLTSTSHPPSFLLNDTATTDVYALSLHDALPICNEVQQRHRLAVADIEHAVRRVAGRGPGRRDQQRRSEEHTSELQSRVDLVCRLLLEKKKNNK